MPVVLGNGWQRKNPCRNKWEPYGSRMRTIARLLCAIAKMACSPLSVLQGPIAPIFFSPMAASFRRAGKVCASTLHLFLLVFVFGQTSNLTAALAFTLANRLNPYEGGKCLDDGLFAFHPIYGTYSWNISGPCAARPSTPLRVPDWICRRFCFGGSSPVLTACFPLLFTMVVVGHGENHHRTTLAEKALVTPLFHGLPCGGPRTCTIFITSFKVRPVQA